MSFINIFLEEMDFISLKLSFRSSTPNYVCVVTCNFFLNKYSLNQISFNCFSEKIRFAVSHEKKQALFSSKNKCKELKCHLRQFLLGTLRVNIGKVL